MTHLYIGQWEWRGADQPAHWRAPGGSAAGSLDMRPLPAQAAAGGIPEGYGIFAYQSEVIHPNLLVHLGDDPDARLGLTLKSEVELLLGSVAANRPRAMIREYLLQGDPTGRNRWKPLRGNPRTGFRCYLGGFGFLFQEQCGPSHDGFANAILRFRADYRRQRDLLPAEIRQKAVGAQMLRLWRQMDDDKAALLLPEEFQGDGWRTPATTIGDTFVEASDTNLESHTATGPNGGFTWTALEGTYTVIAASDEAQCNSAGTQNTYRADQALSTDEHYCQIEARNNTGDNQNRGVIIRKDNTATLTYIHCDMQGVTGAADGWRTFQRVGGTFTAIGSNSSQEVSVGDILKADADGSDLVTRYRNGTGQDSVTNSTGSGNLYCGLNGFDATALIDNFEAADLAAGGGVLLKNPGMSTMRPLMAGGIHG